MLDVSIQANVLFQAFRHLIVIVHCMFVNNTTRLLLKLATPPFRLTQSGEESNKCNQCKNILSNLAIWGGTLVNNVERSNELDKGGTNATSVNISIPIKQPE